VEFLLGIRKVGRQFPVRNDNGIDIELTSIRGMSMSIPLSFLTENQQKKGIKEGNQTIALIFSNMADNFCENKQDH